jgi:hypothetical protein
MRVARPVAYLGDDVDGVVEHARASAEVMVRLCLL